MAAFSLTTHSHMIRGDASLSGFLSEPWENKKMQARKGLPPDPGSASTLNSDGPASV